MSREAVPDAAADPQLLSTNSAPANPDCVYHSSGLLVQSPKLLDLPWLRHASTLRHFSTPDCLRLTELRTLQNMLGLDALPVVYCQQKHTNHVGIVNDPVLSHGGNDRRFIFRETDAIVCPLTDVTIAVVTADCVPMFIVDTRTRAIGVAHAGWQGTLNRIAEQTIRQMQELGSRVEDLLIWIGPAIGGCCYEVSTELIDRFCDEFEDATAASVKFHEGRLLDIVDLNIFQARKLGVSADSISWSGICTLHNQDKFYSYRGDAGTTGRILSSLTVTHQ